MVHCRNLVDGGCSYTGGRCILNNPKTIEQYKLCNGAVLAKDYSEMNRAEKAFVNSIENNKSIAILEARIIELEKYRQVKRKFVGTVVRMPPPDKKGVAEIMKPLSDSSYIKPLPNLPDGTEPVRGMWTRKKGELINWLRHLGK